MPRPKKVVFVDTMIIFEAHRTGCWASLTGSYDLRTVEKVREESLRGRKTREDYIKVDNADFGAKVLLAEVNDGQLASAYMKCEDLAMLDDGEKHLLACVYSLAPDERPLLLTTADKAAIRVACALGLVDNLVSLEELARPGTLKLPLKSQYSSEFLSDVKTTFLLQSKEPP